LRHISDEQFAKIKNEILNKIESRQQLLISTVQQA
jgi:hypothetical protein